MLKEDRFKLRVWFASGEPWVWLNAGAVGISITAVVGLLLLIAVRGFGHFWPASVALIGYTDRSGVEQVVLGEVTDSEILAASQYLEATGQSADALPAGQIEVERWQIKTGNRRVAPPDFRWIPTHYIDSVRYPEDAVVLERMEWGNAYGFLTATYEGDVLSSDGPAAWDDFLSRLQRAVLLREQIKALENDKLNHINYALEQLRLDRKGLHRRESLDPVARNARMAEIDTSEQALQAEFQAGEQELRALQGALHRDSIRLRTASGMELTVNVGDVVRAWRPNAMPVLQKIGHYLHSVGLFLTDTPREANTEGGIYPAIFGTIMMVLLMSILVTPFGVIAALYLREYAKQGPFVRLIRIAVNNLAGVPSIVYGVFGLGFFVYFLGGNLDALFFPDALPAPTFGTPGLLWASLTLALLTVPVVVVSTEEGLTRIPRAIREGSLALGATKAETLFKVVIPMASPAILTGVILAVARAAGEVAPLMLVGVVKLAPSLPLDGNFPFVHLERKFMHLGFHIYDVGFQSPNVDAARPLVYATALLLVLLIVALNLTAIMLRNRLERRYRGVE
ncbi:MAG: phosphate ABC transporter permease PstA [Pseudomonadales bacterium]